MRRQQQHEGAGQQRRAADIPTGTRLAQGDVDGKPGHEAEGGGEVDEIRGGRQRQDRLDHAPQIKAGTAVAKAFLDKVLRQEAENLPARPCEGEVGQDHRAAEHRRYLPLPAPPQRRQKHAGIEFDQRPAGERQAGEPEAAASGCRTAAPQRQRNAGDEHRIDMPAAGEFPKRQRMPGIDDDPRCRPPRRHEHAEHQCDCERFEPDHRRLHRGQALAQPGHREEDRLGRRRIDRRRVIVAIDVGKDRGITQRGEMRVGRDVAIGIDAGGDDPPVPDVAVDVGRQVRRGEDDRNPHRDRRAEDDRHARPRCRTMPGESDREQVYGALPECDGDKRVEIVPLLLVEPGCGQDEEGNPAAEEADEPVAPHKRSTNRRSISAE